VLVIGKATPRDMHKLMFMLAGMGLGGDWPNTRDASTRFRALNAIDVSSAYRFAR
jgi:hypothetical protein